MLVGVVAIALAVASCIMLALALLTSWQITIVVASIVIGFAVFVLLRSVQTPSRACLESTAAELESWAADKAKLKAMMADPDLVALAVDPRSRRTPPTNDGWDALADPPVDLTRSEQSTTRDIGW